MAGPLRYYRVGPTAFHIRHKSIRHYRAEIYYSDRHHKWLGTAITRDGSFVLESSDKLEDIVKQAELLLSLFNSAKERVKQRTRELNHLMAEKTTDWVEDLGDGS